MEKILSEELNKIMSSVGNVAGIYTLIDSYYQLYIMNSDQYQDLVDEALPEATWPENEELLLPVEMRPSGIGSALQFLLTKGFCVDEPDGGFNALMLAVGMGDYYMTQYLLEQGADPNSWPDMDELPIEFRRNYYLEDIDIHYMDECDANDGDENCKAALIKTAEVLVKTGKLSAFCGICLLIKENGEISFDRPHMKY